MDFRDQKMALLECGAAQVEPIRFSKEFSKLSGAEFFKNEILSRNPVAVTVGFDFRFGKQREAGVLELEQLCKKEGISFAALPAVMEGDRPISSTWIREALGGGDFSTAQKLLGRSYDFAGQVAQGRQLGRTLGFPTANLTLAPERQGKLPLSLGVYAGLALKVGGSSKSYPMVMNIGHAPTVHDDFTLKVEAHLLDFTGDLYSQDLRIQPVSLLRGEQKFSSLDALKNQIQLDVEHAKAQLGKFR